MGEIYHYRDFKKPAERWSKMERIDFTAGRCPLPEDPWADTAPSEYVFSEDPPSMIGVTYVPPEKDPA